MAISAAVNAAADDPPADSHRASRPGQDKVPPPGAGRAAPAARRLPPWRVAAWLL